MGKVTQERLSALRKVGLFSGADEKDLEEVAGLLEERTFQEGDALVREGALGSEVFILVEGRCEVRRERNGSYEVLATLGPGELFGEMAVIVPDKRTASVFARSAVRAFVLGGFDFRQALHGAPGLAFQIMKMLAVRLKKSDEKLAALAKK